LVAGRAHVGIIGLEPVGNYAVRITFDDLHDTGVYCWAYLHQLGVQHEKRWRAYLDGLAVKRAQSRARAVAPRVPGASLLGRFISLFGRFNSLFARLGN
jgi:hypothetical protein